MSELIKANEKTVRLISQSLDLYRDRGEFDGTVDSARECLELAGYEWNGDNGISGIVPRVMELLAAIK